LAPVWEALNVDGEESFLPRCEERDEGVPTCSSELITVKEPYQVIVLIEHKS